MKIIADQHIPLVQDYFAPLGQLILKPGRLICHADVHDADILLVRSVTRVNEKLLAGSSVKFVGSLTAGADHLDIAWLTNAGIAYQVAEGFNAPPVADYVISCIAALQHNHRLPTPHFRAAVIGAGHVGRLVVKKLSLLGCSVVQCDPIRTSQEKDFVSVPLADIGDVDLICLHVPLTKKGEYPTYHFLDKTFLARQKPGCVLLNASRGGVIDTEILLEHGSHLTWCLDVWEHEPHINKALLGKAAIATPHIAGYSVQSKLRGIEMIYHALLSQFPHPGTPFKSQPVPTQHLSFSGTNHHWQDIILGIFNPRILTAMMRSLLLRADDTSVLFDKMRQQFHYRHEFKFTQITAQVNEEDKQILRLLDVKI